MKLKSTLWALAFACAAVSCSDDLESGPNGNNGNGEALGESALVAVQINAGITTKASNGEDGDGFEKGDIDESDIKDLTIYLFENSGSTTDFDFKSTSTLVAKGYTAATGSEENPDATHPTTGGTDLTETNHGWQATIEVTMSDKAASFAGKKYGVIAITNMGGSDKLPAIGTGTNQISTGNQLANYLINDLQTESGFIMSSHTLEDNQNHESTVTFPDRSSDNVPEVEVFVERLAAKVRVNEYNNNSTFVYNPTGATTDRVVLNNVAIFNQLSSGSYLLKRVTEENNQFDPTTGDLSDFSDATKDEYLGDEEVNANKLLPVRFVIDPWTRAKTAENVTNLAAINSATETGFTPKALSYDYAYCVASGQTYQTIGAIWSGWQNEQTKNIIPLSGREADDLTYLYTRENTTSKAASLNGYSTGALFQATYYPKQWMVVDETDGSVEATNVSKETDIAKQTAQTFYTYNDDIFKDYKSVFAYTLARIYAEEIGDGKQHPGYIFFDGFTTAGLGNMTVSDFKNSKTLASAADPFGYLKALKTAVEAETDGDKEMNTVTGVKSFEDFMDENGGNDMVEINKLVKVYTNGVCYYPYWIRHENNDDQHVMGVMEFDIVRNNIYDISVSEIKGLGLSEVDVPDPTDPDESGDAQLTVILNVKDWVVRSNSGVSL